MCETILIFFERIFFTHFFFLFLNRTIRSVEEHIKDSLLKEITSIKSASKGIQIDLSTLEIKRTLDADALNTASFVRERVSNGFQWAFPVYFLAFLLFCCCFFLCVFLFFRLLLSISHSIHQFQFIQCYSSHFNLIR